MYMNSGWKSWGTASIKGLRIYCWPRKWAEVLDYVKHVWSHLSSQSWALILSFFQKCEKIHRCAFRLVWAGTGLGEGAG